MRDNKLFFAKFLSLFILLFLAGSLCSGQEAESGRTMAEAQKAYEEKNFDLAFEILAEVVAKDPEQIDKAQRLINKIRKIKDKFNSKLEELIVILSETDIDKMNLDLVRKSRSLIDELQDLNYDPENDAAKALTQAEISLDVYYNKVLFAMAMREGLKELRRKNYKLAVEKYEEGFDIYKKEFDQNEYGILKTPVYIAEQQRDQSIDQYFGQLSRMTRSKERGLSILNSGTDSNYANTQAQMEAVIDSFDEYSGNFLKLYEIAETYREQNRKISAYTNRNEEYYLSFQDIILTGRKGMNFREGIYSTMLLSWEENLTILLEDAKKRSQRYYKEGRQAYLFGRKAEAQRKFESSVNLAGVVDSLLELTENVHHKNNNGSDSFHGAFITNYIVPYQKPIYMERDASQAYITLGPIRDTVGEMDKINRDNLDNARILANEALEAMKEVNELEKTWTAKRNSLNTANVIDRSLIPYVDHVEEALANLRIVYADKRGDAIIVLAEADLAPLEERYTALQDKRAESVKLIDGKASDSEGRATEREPGKGIESIDEIAPDQKTLLEDIDKYQKIYNNELKLVSGNKKGEVRTSIVKSEDLKKMLNRDNTQLLVKRTEGKKAVDEAAQLVAQAKEDYLEADNFLRNGQFEEAKAKKESSRKKFEVAYQYYDKNSYSREEILSDLDFLDEDYQNQYGSHLQKRIAILKDKGIDLYYSEKYRESDSSFQEVVNLYKQIDSLDDKSKIEPDSDLLRWIEIVQNAMSSNSGRVVLETDPLYGEITQLLNLAYSYYSKGKELMGKGQKVDGMKALKKGEDYIRQVKDILVLNQKASILSLMILQVKDADEFQKEFRSRVVRAREKSGSDSRLKQEEALRDLQDLSAINATFPGLEQLLYQIEVKLGTRQKLVTAQERAQSQQIYTGAYAIYRQNDRANFVRARTLLEQALTINPENRAARDLLNIIITSMGGAYTLSPGDRRVYKSAIQLYSSGDYYGARDLVNRLLGNPGNRQYAPLIDLQRRINSRI